MGLLDDELKTKTVRGFIYATCIRACVYGVGLLIFWSVTTAYKLDTKIETESWERNASLTNSHNKTIEREAELLKKIDAQNIRLEELYKKLSARITELEKKRPFALPALPALPDIQTFSLPPIQNDNVPNPAQNSIDFLKEHRKEFRKE
jgi:hypothetical protein